MGEHTGFMEKLEVGTIVEGTVKSVTNFGAFVLLPNGQTGMVHISEVAHSYVSDIREHLAVGDAVKVMVISAENDRINLSIKRTTAPAPRTPGAAPRQRTNGPSGSAPNRAKNAAPKAGPAEPKSFDDMLKQFMSESDSKMSSIRQYSEHKTKTRRR